MQHARTPCPIQLGRMILRVGRLLHRANSWQTRRVVKRVKNVWTRRELPSRRDVHRRGLRNVNYSLFSRRVTRVTRADTSVRVKNSQSVSVPHAGVHIIIYDPATITANIKYFVVFIFCSLSIAYPPACQCTWKCGWVKSIIVVGRRTVTTT